MTGKFDLNDKQRQARSRIVGDQPVRGLIASSWGSVRAMKWPIALAILSFAAPEALAFSTPHPQVSAYGPRTVCIGRYFISVGAREAVVTSSGSHDARLMTQRFYLDILWTEGASNGLLSGAIHSILETPQLGRLDRYEFPPQSGWPGFGDPLTRLKYQLGKDISIRSNAFTGGAQDAAVLARLMRRGPGAPPCDPPVRPSDPAPNYEAALWSPDWEPGPSFECRNGVGLEVRTDEQVQRSWSHMQHLAGIRLRQGPHMLTIRWPLARSARTGRLADAGYHREIIGQSGPGRWTLFLRAPGANAPDSTAELRSRMITIEYDDGREAAVEELIGRIEFLRVDDGRCRAEPAQ